MDYFKGVAGGARLSGWVFLCGKEWIVVLKFAMNSPITIMKAEALAPCLAWISPHHAGSTAALQCLLDPSR